MMTLTDSPAEAEFRSSVRAFLAAELTPELKAAQRLTTTVVTEPAIAMDWHRRLYRKG